MADKRCADQDRANRGRWLGRRTGTFLLFQAILLVPGGLSLQSWGAEAAFVRVSPRDSRYLELSNGAPYIPIGLNLIAPNTREEEGLARMAEWMQKLSANGGNFLRVWISSPFWDVEHRESGAYDEQKAQRIDELLRLAAEHGLRVKLTIEHFREMSDNPRQRWANKPLHLVANGGPARDMADFFDGQASRDQFRRKLKWLADRYGNNPTIFGWELWNEVNAVSTGEAHYMPWTEIMLAELHRAFPRNLALQSLGSFDRESGRDLYRRHSRLPGNDLAQVHRYLDLGASWTVCHGPVDVLTAEAVRELLRYDPGKPVILAESGAVEPRHSGPFKLYGTDKAGMLLHDVLFAPFFAGAAGTGQIWHWDVYVDRNDLWHHFSRFRTAVGDLDPAAERFQPAMLHHPRLRVYVLRGQHTWLAWCRDSQNDWRAELESGRAPELLEDLVLDLGQSAGSSLAPIGRIYDPWNDRWSTAKTDGTRLPLPPFSRSLVVRLEVR